MTIISSTGRWVYRFELSPRIESVDGTEGYMCGMTYTILSRLVHSVLLNTGSERMCCFDSMFGFPGGDTIDYIFYFLFVYTITTTIYIT